MPTLATFNANNFFLRYRFKDMFPGDRSGKSRISREARDEATEVASLGFIPGKAKGGKFSRDFVVWDTKRRELAARALKAPDDRLPDILCFQEVENLDAIRLFNERYLDEHYPYRLLIDGHDMRNIDVGLLSVFPIEDVRTHVDERAGDEYLFSRDCLEVTLAIPRGRSTARLTLFVNHLKSKLVIRERGESDTSFHARIRASHQRRRAQASRVTELMEARFRTTPDALYAVVGDFNDTPFSPWVQPLAASPQLTDVLRTHRGEDCWTYYWRAKGRVSQIDYVLASPALARRVAREVRAGNVPHIERRGLAYREIGATGRTLPSEVTWHAFEADEVTAAPASPAPPPVKVPFDFARFREVREDVANNISDHCPVKIWF